MFLFYVLLYIPTRMIHSSHQNFLTMTRSSTSTFQASLLLLSICLCFLFTEGRLHVLTNLDHLRLVSRISLPPAPAPNPGSPNYIEAPLSPSPSPSPSPTPSSSRANVFNVLSFGAIGDGVTDDTQAFKSAWDTVCSENEASILFVPAGYSFLILPTIFTGPCKNAGLVFQIDGTIMPPDGPELWPKNANKRQWIVFYRINGMLMQGSGVIDGRGEKWWKLPCKPHKGINGTTLPGPCDSPVAIRFFMSSNLTVQGLNVKNSPQFHFRFDNCRSVHVEMLSIRAPALSPNTDGIHIENTNDVHIYDSVISNGDDCVSIGSGCHDVAIKNVTCGPSHGISIGSLGSRNSQACVSNITVTDSTIRHSDNGVRIKTWQGGYGSVSKLTFHNIHMDTVRYPIIIDQYYCLTKNCSNQTSAVYISDIQYTNIKGTYDTRSPPVHLACSDSVPCTNLVMSEIELLPAKGKTVTNPFCWNAYGTKETRLVPEISCLLEGTPTFMAQSVLDLC